MQYRFGGDEFCIILPNFCIHESVAVGERLREGIASILLEGVPDNLSSSIGVASYPAPTKDPVVLLETADKAMYVSKNEGGNRVSVGDVDVLTTKKSAHMRLTPEQIEDRLSAVDVELSIDQGAQYFIVNVKNKSDEEVRIKKISLSFQGVKVAEAPQRPDRLDEWDIAPRGCRQITWNATNDPCHVLMSLLRIFDRPAEAILKVYIQAEVLGRLRTFDQQHIQVQSDPGARRMWQIR